MKPISCQGILFDLDGTLVDSWKCIEYAWQSWCREHAIDYQDLVRKFNGTRAVDIVRQLKPDLDYQIETNKIDMFELSHPENLIPITGALEFLKVIPDHKWGIVTSGTHHVSSHKLKYAQIKIPNTFVTAEQVNQSKPHPQGYLMAASLLGIDPKDCLVFEDAPAGVKAARAAGMKVIALTTTFPKDILYEAEICIENYNNLKISTDHSQITVSLSS